MYTLIIKQAKRIDGAIIDILIKDGKIDAAGPELVPTINKQTKLLT